MTWQELDYLLTSWGRKGGKISRRRQIKRVRQFLDFCRTQGVRGPDQAGNRHAYEWYREVALAEATLRDRYYAMRLLWTLLGRGDPPHFSEIKTTLR